MLILTLPIRSASQCKTIVLLHVMGFVVAILPLEMSPLYAKLTSEKQFTRYFAVAPCSEAIVREVVLHLAGKPYTWRTNMFYCKKRNECFIDVGTFKNVHTATKKQLTTHFSPSHFYQVLLHILYSHFVHAVNSAAVVWLTGNKPSINNSAAFYKWHNKYSETDLVCTHSETDLVCTHWPCLHTLALSNPAGRQLDAGMQNPSLDGLTDTLAKARGGTTKRSMSIPFKPCDSLKTISSDLSTTKIVLYSFTLCCTVTSLSITHGWCIWTSKHPFLVFIMPFGIIIISMYMLTNVMWL